jgi:hypothetical protein
LGDEWRVTEREQYPVISVKYYEICMCGFSNRIGGVMVSVLAAINRGFETRSGETKDYEICICGFSTKPAALRRKSKDWLTRNKLPENIQQHLIKLESKTKINNDELSQIRKDVQAASDRMIGLSLEEKVMINRAMAREFMGSGHWYKCMNGKSTKE